MDFIGVLKSRPQSIRTSFFKTIINSWATSHRLSENVLLPCIFGCRECEDNLKHYLCCDPLWTLATSASGLSSCFLGQSPAERLCLWNKSIYGLQLLRVVYSVYHIVKLGHRELISHCIECNSFEVIHDLAPHIAKETWDHP